MSVILPVFNRRECVAAAIESVLAQTYSNWELVIADDGSGADTADYLASLADPRIRVLSLSHSGVPSKVRNAAIRVARGHYLAFLDSDDVWAPAKLTRQLAAHDAQPSRRWSYTRVGHIDESGRRCHPNVSPWRPFDGNIVEALLVLDALVATPSVVAERSLVEEAGLFDEEQRYGEDYELWLRLADRSDVIALPDELASVRIHSDHYSRDRVGAYEGWVRLYGKMAGLLPDPSYRSLSRRRQVASSLVLAGIHADSGDRLQTWRTLLDAVRYSWSTPSWWWGAAKTAARPVIPPSFLAAYRSAKKSGPWQDVRRS